MSSGRFAYYAIQRNDTQINMTVLNAAGAADHLVHCGLAVQVLRAVVLRHLHLEYSTVQNSVNAFDVLYRRYSL